MARKKLPGKNLKKAAAGRKGGKKSPGTGKKKKRQALASLSPVPIGVGCPEG